MSKEILMVVDAVSNEKGVEKDIIFEAIEAALASATRRRHGEDIDVRVAIDRESGDYDTFRRWLVFEDESTELEFPDRELRMIDAVDVDESRPSPAATSRCRWNRSSSAVSRPRRPSRSSCRRSARPSASRSSRSSRTAKASCCPGLVKRVDRNGVYIDLGGNAEGFVPRDQMVPREPVRPQDRMKALLTEVRSEPRGPQLFMTRTSPQFLIELFKIEVPEVGQGLIDILGAARDPGLRAKIAVKSNDNRIDPVGACVGMRGSRVQAVSNELAGERVDIILWDENPAQFVVNAMSPAEVVSIVVDEDAHSMDIAVDEDKLSQAIGRGGQNIRLASELSGWELNVMTESDAEQKSEAEMRELIEMFSKQLDVDEEIGLILVQEGFSTIEEVAYVPASELVEIEEFDEDIVDELRSRARDVLLTQAIVQEEKIDEAEPAEDLLSLEGMDKGLAFCSPAKAS